MSYQDSKSKTVNRNPAEQIKRLREKSGKTQEDLAKAIGCTKYVISNIEQRKSAPSLDDVIRIAQCYNVSVDFICGLTEDMSTFTNTLDVLRRYVSLDIEKIKMSRNYELPIISINKYVLAFFNALIEAEQLREKGVPDKIIDTYLKNIKEEAQKSIEGAADTDDMEKFVLLNYDGLDENELISSELLKYIEETYKEKYEM